jgi:hypothetical protein
MALRGGVKLLHSLSMGGGCNKATSTTASTVRRQRLICGTYLTFRDEDGHHVVTVLQGIPIDKIVNRCGLPVVVNNNEVLLVANDHHVMRNSPRVFLASINKRPTFNNLLPDNVERINSVKATDTDFISTVIDDVPKAYRDLRVVDSGRGFPVHGAAQFFNQAGNIVIISRSLQKILKTLVAPIAKKARSGRGAATIGKFGRLMVIGDT